MHFYEKYEKIKWEVKKLYKGKKYKEQAFYTRKYGNRNPDKKFYVLSEFDGKKMGILSCFLLFLPEAEWAVKCGYIPVFDLKTHWAELSQKEEAAYKENAWDYYFEQKYNLEEVYESKNVMHGWKMYKFPHYVSFTYKKITSDEIKRWSSFVKKYMNFNSQIIECAESFWQENHLKDEKVLGFEMRSNFILTEKYKELLKGHPIQKGIEEQKAEARELMSKWGCSKIFVFCEDREWVEEFKKEFGNKCIEFSRERYHFFKNGLPIKMESAERENREIFSEFENVDAQKRTWDYLVEVYLLTKCNSLRSCMASAGNFAQIYNGGKYEHVSCSENGRIDL